MIYVPGKFLFIHIPRTAGNAISRTLMKSLSGEVDMVCATSAMPNVIHRHSRAIELLPFVPDFHRIKRFAVSRPYSEIVQSDYRIVPVRDENIAEFERRRWMPWLAGQTPEQHWCGDIAGRPLGFELIPFDTLNGSGWKRICEITGLPPETPLSVCDWQKQQYLDQTG